MGDYPLISEGQSFDVWIGECDGLKESNTRLFGKTEAEITQYHASQLYLAAKKYPKLAGALETLKKKKELGDTSLKTSGTFFWKKYCEAVIAVIKNGLKHMDSQRRDNLITEWSSLCANRLQKHTDNIDSFQLLCDYIENLKIQTNEACVDGDIGDRQKAKAILQCMPKFYQLQWGAALTDDKLNDPDELIKLIKKMCKPATNKFSAVGNSSNVRDIHQSTHDIGGAGFPSAKGQRGKGGNGKGQAGTAPGRQQSSGRA
uniref:Uncharacterized protein n=1 Tax=Chromera velia CCMP2878 TaxID=1169474 RepID=A0A0G4HDT7_9ALVE|eukprot:Cvel_26587.t1-p1 / transcript=Cvel_26587.t1 / gene=Cvel_26587 / organism=Chromera_velia_CCMP2878 / gene_product=hypothetical protein / transcript_product=hypothetical protein / location=Cvel_scaffold3184:8687-9460(+) / protein_length=258 / sequence_SO=supercontig / SO=protein_coding / is_pseudo=false